MTLVCQEQRWKYHDAVIQPQKLPGVEVDGWIVKVWDNLGFGHGRLVFGPCSVPKVNTGFYLNCEDKSYLVVTK